MINRGVLLLRSHTDLFVDFLRDGCTMRNDLSHITIDELTLIDRDNGNH